MTLRRFAARALELAGLLLVLNALVLGVVFQASMGVELKLALLGTALFAVGYAIDRRPA